MDKFHRLRSQRLTALFLLGCLLFNYPVLTIFDRNGLIGGIPILYVYIFVSWAALIGLTALVIERRK